MFKRTVSHLQRMYDGYKTGSVDDACADDAREYYRSLAEEIARAIEVLKKHSAPPPEVVELKKYIVGAILGKRVCGTNGEITIYGAHNAADDIMSEITRRGLK